MQEAFGFKKEQVVANRLLNRKMPAVSVNERTNTIECKHNDSEPTLTRAEQPLDTSQCVAYFEAEIIGLTEESKFNVGLIMKDTNMKQPAGKSANSVGYCHNDNKYEIWLSKKKTTTSDNCPKIEVGSRIGCGINCHNRTFFFTNNGSMLANAIPVPMSWHEFYPAVGLSMERQAIKCHFAWNQCLFKVKDYADNIKRQITREIKGDKVDNKQVYSLVYEYLKFNGYNQTAELMNKTDIDFVRLTAPARNQDMLCAELVVEGETIVEEQQSQPVEKQINKPLPDILLDHQGFFAFKQRKFSLFSNISNISKVSNLSQEEYLQESEDQLPREMPQEPSQMSNLERFLTVDRIEIMKLIREERIQEALSIMNKKIPSIFQTEKLLMTFMKAHIFLRKVRSGTGLEAILYAKGEQEFYLNKDHLFPFYSTEDQCPKWLPLKNVFKALSQQEQLRDQFDYFSYYVNALVLRRLGYLPDSRLGLLLQNTKRVLEKVGDYKGMACGVELAM